MEQLLNPAILQPLVRKLNALHVWDDDIVRLISVHPLLATRLLNSGLRTPILDDYFTSIKSADSTTFLALRKAAREQIGRIVKAMGFDIFVQIMTKTMPHSPTIRIMDGMGYTEENNLCITKFECMLGITNGRFNFVEQFISQDDSIWREEVEWFLQGYKYNKELYKQKIAHMLSNNLQYSFASGTLMQICKAGGISLLEYLLDANVFVFSSFPLTVEDYVASMLRARDLTAEQCIRLTCILCLYFEDKSLNIVRSIAKHAPRHGRINAIKWASEQPSFNFQDVQWLSMVESNCKEMVEWYLETAKRNGHKSSAIKYIYSSKMSLELMDYLDSTKLGCPATGMLFSHPEITIQRAMQYPYFPNDLYISQSKDNMANTGYFNLALFSFDIEKVKYAIKLSASQKTTQGGLAALQQSFIHQMLYWIIPEDCETKDFGAFIDSVRQELKIPMDEKNAMYREFKQRCACICTIRSESARRYIERYMAEPFTPLYYTQQAYRMLANTFTLDECTKIQDNIKHKVSDALFYYNVTNQ